MQISSGKNEELKLCWKSYISGDKEAFGTIYAYFHKSLTAYCIGRLRSLELAENAASDTLIKLMQYKKPEEIENFENWMFTVAKNICTTHLTKTERRNKILKDNYQIENTHEPEVNSVFLNENIDRIISANLDKRDLAIWQMHQQGYENHEIALEIGISEKTVANRKSMARFKLREVINKMSNK